VYQSRAGEPRLSQDQFRETLDTYLSWVCTCYDRAQLYGIDSFYSAGERRRRYLHDVFVSLSFLHLPPPSRDELRRAGVDGRMDGLLAVKAYLKVVVKQRQEAEVIPLKELLAVGRRVAVIGGAGSGKSTLLAYLAVAFARRAETGMELPVQLLGKRRNLVPIVIPLRYYREYTSVSLFHRLKSLGGFRA